MSVHEELIAEIEARVKNGYLFNDAHKVVSDVRYLLGRLEAAERAARSLAAVLREAREMNAEALSALERKP